jgi:hypothetical protein
MTPKRIAPPVFLALLCLCFGGDAEGRVKEAMELKVENWSRHPLCELTLRRKSPPAVAVVPDGISRHARLEVSAGRSFVLEEGQRFRLTARVCGRSRPRLLDLHTHADPKIDRIVLVEGIRPRQPARSKRTRVIDLEDASQSGAKLVRVWNLSSVDICAVHARAVRKKALLERDAKLDKPLEAGQSFTFRVHYAGRHSLQLEGCAGGRLYETSRLRVDGGVEVVLVDRELGFMPGPPKGFARHLARRAAPPPHLVRR